MTTAIQKAIDFAGTQEKLADLIGIKQQTISRWIRRKSIPSVKNATLLEEKTNGVVTREQIFSELLTTQ